MYQSAKSSPIANICPKLLAEGKIEITQTIEPEQKKEKHGNNIMTDNDENPNGADLEENTLKDKNPSSTTITSEWSYVVMSYIDGTNIMTAREEERQIDMAEVAVFLANNLSLLHKLKVPHIADPYDDYLKFLQKRREKAVRSHWLWGTLPPALITQIEGYLPNNLSELICAEHVVPIHSDITDENVIGVESNVKPKKTKKAQRAKKYVFEMIYSRLIIGVGERIHPKYGSHNIS